MGDLTLEGAILCAKGAKILKVVVMAEVRPQRMCIACRTRSVQRELCRIACQDGMLIYDEQRRIPGRGAWVHPDSRCLKRAQNAGALAHALRLKAVDAENLSVLFETIRSRVATARFE